MKYRTKAANHILRAIATLSLCVASLQAAPPKAVSEMNKKELKRHNRDIKEHSFEIQENKDRKTGITWLQSKSESDPSTPAIGYYFRSGFKNGKPVTIQLIVTNTHIGINQFDHKTMAYSGFKLDGKLVITEVGDPHSNPNADIITQISSLRFTEKVLRAHKDTGLDLKAISSFGETDVPVRAAYLTSYIERFDKLMKKLNK